MNPFEEKDWEIWLGDIITRTRKVGKYSRDYMSKNFPGQQ